MEAQSLLSPAENGRYDALKLHLSKVFARIQATKNAELLFLSGLWDKKLTGLLRYFWSVNIDELATTADLTTGSLQLHHGDNPSNLNSTDYILGVFHELHWLRLRPPRYCYCYRPAHISPGPNSTSTLFHTTLGPCLHPPRCTPHSGYVYTRHDAHRILPLSALSRSLRPTSLRPPQDPRGLQHFGPPQDPRGLQHFDATTYFASRPNAIMLPVGFSSFRVLHWGSHCGVTICRP